MDERHSLWQRLVAVCDRFLTTDFGHDIIELDEAEVMEDLLWGREPRSVVAFEAEDPELADRPVHLPAQSEMSIGAAR